MAGNPLMGMLGNANGNPVVMLAQIMKSGGNPQKLIQNMMSQNPQIKGVLDMMQNGNTQGLQEMAVQMSQKTGVSIEDMAKQIGLDMPK